MRPHPALLPMSWLYGLAVTLRNAAYDTGLFSASDAGVPVISIGNITAGGTGKTPVTADAAHTLLAAGIPAAVVSRGYGRRTAGTVVVSDGRNLLATADEGGDEPVLLAASVPGLVVIADEDRVRGARLAVERFGVRCVLLDDGFQHRRLKRDLDIVLMNEQRPPFVTALLPAGYRREPLSRFARAQAVMVTKSRSPEAAAALLSRPELSHALHRFTASYEGDGVTDIVTGERRPLDALRGLPVAALCGIAEPEGFLHALTAAGADVTERTVFADHHRYTEADVRSVRERAERSGARLVMTTEKDAVKLRPLAGGFGGVPVSALTMRVRIAERERWKEMLLAAARTV